MPYTQGVWKVKPGRADEFAAAWKEFAEWTSANADGAGWAKLLRDRADPSRFVSVGPWESLDAIERWRGLEGWKIRIAHIRELLESFEASTLDVAVEVDELRSM